MFTLSHYGPLLAAGTEDWWTQQFFGLEQTQRFVLIIVAIGCVTCTIISVVAIVGKIIESMHKRRVETEMKRELLDRGMSADEVARVVESAQPKDFLERWAAAQGKAKTP
jgi:hypothetical protein